MQEDISSAEAAHQEPDEPSFRKKRLPSRRSPRTRSPILDIQETAREREKKIEKKLAEIYGNTDGTMPDMKQFETRKRSPILRAAVVFIFSCALLGGVVWAGFFAWPPQAVFSGDDVSVSLSGESRVNAGQEYQYAVRYVNASSVSLSNVLLSVRVPDGFVITTTSVSSTDETRQEWRIGTLAPGEEGSLEIAGKFFADVSTEQSFRIFLNYIPSNFSSEFQEAGSFPVMITGALAALSIEGPEEAAVGSETEFTVTLESSGRVETLPDIPLVLRVDSPSGFLLKGSNPAMPTGGNEWKISPTGTRQFRFRGIFSPADDVEAGEIHARIIGWKDQGRQGDGFIYASAKLPVKFLRTDMAVSLVVNGSMSDGSVTPGESVHATLAIRNAGDAQLQIVRSRIIIDAPSFHNQSIMQWNELSDPLDGIVKGEQLDDTTRRGSVTWTAQHSAAFREFAPGTDVFIELQVPLKQAPQTDISSFQTHLIHMAGEVVYRINGEEKTVSTKPLSLLINSDTALDVRDEVSDTGDGKELHRVSWVLSNTFHDLANVSLEADVYGDIAIAENDILVPGGKVVYDREKKKIVWTVDAMPTSVDVLAMQFPILLNTKNPTQTNLTSKVTVHATDTATGEEMVIVGDEILLETKNVPSP